MRYDNRLVKIIMENAELADTSLAGFFIKCYMDSGNDTIKMASALNHYIVPDLGGLKAVMNIITNDERYFKWDSLDTLNREGGWGSHGILAQLYHDAISSMKIEDMSIAPDIDFTVGDNIAWYDGTQFYPTWGRKYGPCINGHIYYSETSRMDKDLYSGVIVSRSIYPNASEVKAEDAHFVHVFTERKPIGESHILVDERLHQMRSYNVVGKGVGGLDIEYDDPGLIYVQVKNKLRDAIKPMLSNYEKGQFAWRTCLPKHILDKYGLPVAEI